MRAAGGLSRQVLHDPPSPQLRIAGCPAPPLLPGDGAEPPPDPLVKCAHYRRRFAEAEVAPPSCQIAGEAFDDLFKACSARPARQFADSGLEAGERRRCNAPLWHPPGCEAEAQELSRRRLGNRALRFVDLQLQTLR